MALNQLCAEGRWYSAYEFSDTKITALTVNGTEVMCVAGDNTIRSEHRQELIPDSDPERLIRVAAGHKRIIDSLLNRPQPIAVTCYACTLATISNGKIYCQPNHAYLKTTG